MSGRILTGASLLIIVVLVSSCSNHKDSEGGGSPPDDTKKPSINITVGTEAEAIEKVKYYIASQSKTRTVNVPSRESERVQVACTQLDVDTDPYKGDELQARCKPLNGGPGAPYGFKWETRWTTVVRPKTITLQSTEGRWTTESSESPDNWDVGFHFKVEDVDEVVSWLVNKQTGEVTEKK